MIIEIHMLQTHSPGNPNRDDLGAPKRTIFGGVPRMRISSQCIKRSIRTSEFFKSPLASHIGTRTVFFPDLVRQALAKHALPEEDHDAIVARCTTIAKEEKKTAVADADTSELSDERPRTDQLIFLSPTEVDEFVKELALLRAELPAAYAEFIATKDTKTDAKAKPAKKDAAKSNKKDMNTFIGRLRGVFKHDAADIALFGRMTTSDYFENVEAAMQVAHALSVDAAVPEVDYYTAVDDLPTPGKAGSAFLDEAQFASATFYKYFSLNVDQLRRNLGDDDALVARTIAAFLNTAARAIPSGKRNSYANNNLPDAILVEVRPDNVAASYANAFLTPAANYKDTGVTYNVLQDAMRKLRAYARRTGDAYGLQGARCWFAIPELPPIKSGEDLADCANAASLDQLVDFVASALAEARHA